MGRIESERALLPSILDRLIDEDSEGGERTGRHVLRDLRSAVARDLENLLNTRRRLFESESLATAVASSVVAYGIPDPTGANLAARKAREAFVRGIEATIRAFEPRLSRVRVSLQEGAAPYDRVLRFRIEAVLHAQQSPEPVVYDSRLEPVRRAFEVRG